MKLLFILNDAPYGSERTYNALRLAGSAARKDDVETKLFLIGDAVAAATTSPPCSAPWSGTEASSAYAARASTRGGSARASSLRVLVAAPWTS